MHVPVCVKYKTFLHFIRPSLLTALQAAELLLALAAETTSILWERRAASLSSLRLLLLRPHLPRLFFAFCVCVSHTKKVALTAAAAGMGLYERCWIQRRHGQAAQLLGQENDYFERALRARLLFVPLGLPLPLPHVITLWPGHRVLKRDSICLSEGNVASVLVGGCKYNIISRSLWLLLEIIPTYVQEQAPLSAGGGVIALLLHGPWRSPL